MDIKELDTIAKDNIGVGNKLNIKDQIYYIAVRGLYSQHKKGEISLEQAKEEKEILVKWHKEVNKPVAPIKQIVYLNKDKVVEAVILELGRYISCGTTNVDREKAYPRKLFEKRIVEIVDKAYGVWNYFYCLIIMFSEQFRRDRTIQEKDFSFCSLCLHESI